jgi:hypothetical protein
VLAACMLAPVDCTTQEVKFFKPASCQTDACLLEC